MTKPMTDHPGPDSDIHQRKEFWATMRRRSFYAAFAGGVLMIPLSVLAATLFLLDSAQWGPVLDHVRIIGILSMIGSTLLGGGLGIASHSRKQYRKLELSETRADP